MKGELAMTLNQAQIDSFWKDGYLAYGKVFDDQEIEHYRNEYEALFDHGDGLRELGTDKKRKLKQIMQACEKSVEFRKLVYEPRILDVIEDLIGPNIQLFHDQALYKEPNTGGQTPWHQDNGYWKCRPATLVSCWMTFDDVTEDNGAMQFVPGSHLSPVWHDHESEAHAKGGLLNIDIDKEVGDRKIDIVDLPAGGCLFHHCQTLHYTAPNTTPNKRRAFAIHYMQPGTVGTEKNHHNDMSISFSNPLVRCRF